MTRVYLPGTAKALARLAAERSLGPPPLEAYAVTAALRAALPDLDEEELEYVATIEAGRASVARVALDGDVPRRVVIAGDVASGAIGPAPDFGVAGVVVAAPVPLADIASIHVDDADAEAAVRAAEADPESEPLLDAVEEHDLSWWTTQELADLLGALGQPGPA